MTSNLILYSAAISPPCRFVLMTLKTLGLKVQVVEVDLFKGEHKTEEYTKLNPTQKVPVLKDRSLTLIDSHAISTYFCNKYNNLEGASLHLYPIEPAARARVDQMLCFDMTCLFPANSTAMSNFFASGMKRPPSDQLWKNIESSYKLLNCFLKKSTWMSGDKMTLSDLCCLATITSAELLVPLNAMQYPLVAAWLERCKKTPQHMDENQPGVEKLKSIMESLTNMQDNKI